MGEKRDNTQTPMEKRWISNEIYKAQAEPPICLSCSKFAGPRIVRRYGKRVSLVRLCKRKRVYWYPEADHGLVECDPSECGAYSELTIEPKTGFKRSFPHLYHRSVRLVSDSD